MGGAPDSLRWPRRGERRRCPRALPLRGVFPEFPNIRLTPMSCCLRSLMSHLYLLHLPCRPPCSTCLAAPLASLALLHLPFRPLCPTCLAPLALPRPLPHLPRSTCLAPL